MDLVHGGKLQTTPWITSAPCKFTETTFSFLNLQININILHYSFAFLPPPSMQRQPIFLGIIATTPLRISKYEHCFWLEWGVTCICDCLFIDSTVIQNALLRPHGPFKGYRVTNVGSFIFAHNERMSLMLRFKRNWTDANSKVGVN